jgi:outer membrane protein assembly factor BamB
MSHVGLWLLCVLVWVIPGRPAEPSTSSAVTSGSHADVWPQFRGPNGGGVALRGSFPTHFGPASNVLWQCPTPSGHSSPCIWGERVFLTGFENNELRVLCLDRATGKTVWQKALPPGKLEKSGRWSNPANSTQVTDGRHLVTYFGSFGLLCHDFEGNEQWRLPLPTPVTQHGASSSPVLAGDRVLLLRDQDMGSHLMAVGVEDGCIAWKTERPNARRGFSTPLVHADQGRTLAVVAGTLRLTAYDAATGAEVWGVSGLPNEMCSSPVASEGLIFAAGWTPGSGVPRMPGSQTWFDAADRNKDGRISREEAPSGPARQHFNYIDADRDGLLTREEWDSMADVFNRSSNALLAVQPGGSGDVSATHVRWRQQRGLPYVPSPLCSGGRVHLVKNGGLASCFKASTGEVLYQEERLGALGDYYASPVAANGKICMVSQPGVLVILEASDTLVVLARNPMGEEVLATPAIVDDTLYVRTATRLYAFREAKLKPGPMTSNDR